MPCMPQKPVGEIDFGITSGNDEITNELNSFYKPGRAINKFDGSFAILS